MLLTFVIAVLVVIGLLVVKIRQLESYWRKAGIPYESYLSYLHCHYIRFRNEVVYDVLREYSERYGPLYGTYKGFKPLLRITSIEGMKDALITNFSSIPRRGFDVETGVPLWDSTINALPYDKWKLARQVSGTAFTSSKLRGLTKKIEQLGHRFADRIADIAQTSGRIEPLGHAHGFALDSIAAIAFGLDLDTMADPESKFVESAKGLFDPGIEMFLFVTAPTLLKYVPFVQFPKKQTTAFFQEFTSAVIKQRRQRGLAALSKSEYDILDLWLNEQKSNPSFTDNMIVSQTFLFLVAGLDTTAYTLHHALYFLAMHPSEQERALAEINSTVKLDGTSSFDDFSKLKFVESCVIETLRLCPTDSIIDRVCSAPCTIAGVSVTPGTAIQIVTPAIHRDPTYFPEPDSFRPGRFLDGSSEIDAFMSFGQGPKNCLGRRLALLQLTVALSCILKKVRLSQCAETPTTLEFTEGVLFLPFTKQPLVIGIEKRSNE